ncbi:K02A2.6-like [Cordylochernes scorpioides]|uniref:K02A2.6-like n=1 Tax=Cordylochernes scorpioides TaxID=51811 RepID=A0ABY6KN76_9ARAC|nr:K02A2.6-like [Cordylochernes scorpioides]
MPIFTIEKFDESTESWERYTKRLEYFFEANNIDQNKCYPPTTKAISDGLIAGIEDDSIQRKPFDSLTLHKAIEIALALEAAEEVAKDLQSQRNPEVVKKIKQEEISSQIFKIINLWRTPYPIKIEVQINDKILSLEYDTGSAYSLISTPLRGSLNYLIRVKLATYSGQPLKVLVMLDVPVQYHNSTQTLPLMVVGGEGPNLCGRNWMEALGILPTQPYKVDMIEVTENNLPIQLHIFRELFKPGYSVFKGVRAKLLVDPEMKPRFFKSCPIPYALKENISRELDRLVKAGILTPC